MMTITKGGVQTVVPSCWTVMEPVLNTQVKAAERNGNGRMNRETLPNKWSIQMEWEFSTPEEYYAWFNYLASLTRVDFTVHFPAPTGRMEEAEMYISPISARMLNMSRGATGWWKTLKCSFVEV